MSLSRPSCCWPDGCRGLADAPSRKAEPGPREAGHKCLAMPAPPAPVSSIRASQSPRRRQRLRRSAWPDCCCRARKRRARAWRPSGGEAPPPTAPALPPPRGLPSSAWPPAACRLPHPLPDTTVALARRGRRTQPINRHPRPALGRAARSLITSVAVADGQRARANPVSTVHLRR